VKILFIRHAKAVDRVSWLRDDMLRPLSDKGVSTAKSVFRAVSKIYDTPDLVLASETLRARETADIFLKFFPAAKLEVVASLNPGFDFENFKNIIAKNIRLGMLVLIGHEPDFSSIISELFESKHTLVDFKKCAVLEIEIEENSPPVLRALIPPKVF